MRWLTFALFSGTYVAISARRLQLLPVGRPAAALIGAVALVVVGLFDAERPFGPEDAFRAIEPHTMTLLFGMMLISAGLGAAGFFDLAADAAFRRVSRPVPLLYAITLGSGLLSALLVNDAVCLLATPLVVKVADRCGAPRVPYLFGVAMGANAGSALTLGGNPQNMLVARLSGMAYRDYLFRAGPSALVALLLTAILLHAFFRRHLARASSAPLREGAPAAITTNVSPDHLERHTRSLYFSLLVLLGVTIADLAGAHLAFTALAGGAVVLLASGRRAASLFERVDWTVLVFFASLFVVVGALERTGLAAEALARVSAVFPPSGARGIAILCSVLSGGSQIVSNVPLILLLEPYIRTFADGSLAWTLTALVSTLAGNLTLLGSVANLIVIEQAGAQDEIGFWEYLRVGLPVTAVSTIAAVALVLLRS
jgi:Na+/H+ antiporter NhaD/arsenite permease-like protein